MRIETEFDIPRPPDEAYAVLLDLERVAPCVPGAECSGRAPGRRAARCGVTVRLGPMKFAYEGKVRIDERDDAALRAVLEGDRARGPRGRIGRGAASRCRSEEAAGGARVTTEADVELTGRAAQMGRGHHRGRGGPAGRRDGRMPGGGPARRRPVGDAPRGGSGGRPAARGWSPDARRRPRPPPRGRGSLAAAGAVLMLVVGLVLVNRRGRSRCVSPPTP